MIEELHTIVVASLTLRVFLKNMNEATRKRYLDGLETAMLEAAHKYIDSGRIQDNDTA